MSAFDSKIVRGVILLLALIGAVWALGYFGIIDSSWERSQASAIAPIEIEEIELASDQVTCDPVGLVEQRTVRGVSTCIYAGS